MGCQGWKAIVLSPRPLIIDFDIPALYIPSFVQALENRCEPFLETLGRPAIEKPDHRHRRLLRARRERPCRRATEKCDELAPLHSITPSAVVSTQGGTVRPNIRAVSALLTSSNFVACTTGKSAGFSPLRIRPA